MEFIPPQIENWTTFEFRFGKYHTIGLNLVKTLVKQLSGIIEINLDNGTQFVIKFEQK